MHLIPSGGYLATPPLENIHNLPVSLLYERVVLVISTDLEKRLARLVADQLGVEVDQVKPEASFTDDLNADSLDLVELIMALEEEFGIEIPDEDSEKMVTVGDAFAYIKEHVNE